MDWETFEKHKAFAGERKPSMLRRRVGHDYESRRIYLITMTVEGRRPLLGRLVGNADAPQGSAEAPRVELSPLGQEVEACWQAIGEHYPSVRLPIIFLTPWGFNEFSRPGHQYYEACAEGRFLILAPWKHQNQRLPLTRDMCLKLNAMTEEVSDKDNGQRLKPKT